MEIEIAVAILILFALTFLATIDMAFSQLSDVTLRRLTSDTEEDTRVNTPFMREILTDRPRFRFALSAAIQILLIIFSVLFTLIVYNFYTETFKLILISMILALTFSAIFRQFIPRFLTWRNPEDKLLFLIPFVRPFYPLMAFFADPFARFLREKEQANPETTLLPNQTEEKDEEKDDNIQALIEMGEAEGFIEEEERELIETMFEFGDTRAGEIMTPRTEICSVPITATVKAARDVIIEEKYSRMPVYRDSTDNIEGVIYVRDLLNAWSENKENETIETLLRPAYFVPETKSVSELLKNMQTVHVQLAIVIDEYGGIAGLITVEDILEEIVGEIEDEDTEHEEIIEIIEGEDKSYYDILGSTDIGKIERLFDLEIEDDDFTTIAGLITSEVGYVPKPGENLECRGLQIEILHADEKKIHLLRIKKPASEEESETQEVST
ncbi:MAG: hemolysin family protein [Pyrinomonadaceae bacterium]